MEMTYKALAHRAGCIRKKYKLTPLEAAWCVLWLLGVDEPAIPCLSGMMAEMGERKRKKKGSEE